MSSRIDRVCTSFMKAPRRSLDRLTILIAFLHVGVEQRARARTAERKGHRSACHG
jgi:hypothetical protein